MITVPPPLTESRLLAAVDDLAAADPALGAVVERFGPPPLWAREPGFPTLVHLILEQQVSLASAQAAFDRLRAAADPLTPRTMLRLDDAQLLAVGFSRQKARYARALATAVDDGSLDIDGLAGLDDDEVDAALTALPGDRAVDLDDLPADGAAAARCLAGPRHRARPGARGAPRPRRATGRGGDARPRRGVAAVAGRRRPDPVAPLPLDPKAEGQSRTLKVSASTGTARQEPDGRTRRRTL